MKAHVIFEYDEAYMRAIFISGAIKNISIRHTLWTHIGTIEVNISNDIAYQSYFLTSYELSRSYIEIAGFSIITTLMPEYQINSESEKILFSLIPTVRDYFNSIAQPEPIDTNWLDVHIKNSCKYIVI